MDSHRQLLLGATLAFSLLVGMAAASANAVSFASGDLSVIYAGQDLLDTRTDIVLGGRFGTVTYATDDFSSVMGSFVTLNTFSYAASSGGGQTFISSGGPAALDITLNDIVVTNEMTGVGVEEVSLVGTGMVTLAGFDPTAVSWSLTVSDLSGAAGIFTLSAQKDGGGGIGAAVPEPNAAMVFGAGVLVVGLGLRRSNL